VGGACGTHGGKKLIRLLVGKPEGKTTRGRHWRRWEDPIKIRLECGGGVNWID
jgi:hypothetical protein